LGLQGRAHPIAIAYRYGMNPSLNTQLLENLELLGAALSVLLGFLASRLARRIGRSGTEKF
jgi:hypothetical protein